MSEEHVVRAQLIGIRVTRLAAEQQNCTDLDRLTAIGDELELLRQSLLDIREEQLLEQLERVRPRERPPWWRRLLP